MEIAVFRRILGSSSYFITVSKNMIKDAGLTGGQLTATISSPLVWPRHEHVVLTLGKGTIYGSYKVTLKKEIVEDLGLRKGAPIWVRIIPFTDTPPSIPRCPYILKPLRVHTDNSSMFVMVSRTQIDYIDMVCPGDELKVTVYIEDIAVRFKKRPVPVGKIYKITLLKNVFEPKNVFLYPGMPVFVKLAR